MAYYFTKPMIPNESFYYRSLVFVYTYRNKEVGNQTKNVFLNDVVTQ